MPAKQVFHLLGRLGTETVDHLLADLVVVGAKTNVFPATIGNDQAGGCHVRLVFRQHRQDFAEAFGHYHFELDIQSIGKALGHVVFDARRAIGAFIISSGRIAREHD